jgi:hypothetical protein
MRDYHWRRIREGALYKRPFALSLSKGIRVARNSRAPNMPFDKLRANGFYPAVRSSRNLSVAQRYMSPSAWR